MDTLRLPRENQVRFVYSLRRQKGKCYGFRETVAEDIQGASGVHGVKTKENLPTQPDTAYLQSEG